MASRLVRSYTGGAVWVRAQLCSWAKHFNLTVRLPTQVYKWVLALLMLGEPFDGLASHLGGVEIHATKNGRSSGLMGHLARMQTYFLWASFIPLSSVAYCPCVSIF